MRRALRATGWVGAVALAGVVIALLAVRLLADSDWGREQARRFALRWLAGQVQGTVSIARLGGGSLLHGVVLHQVAMVDRRGRPFLELDSARAAYSWRTLLAGRIVLDRVELYRPRIHLEQLPGDTAWNYQHLFADTSSRPRPETGTRRLVLFHQIAIADGEATVLTPVGDADTTRAIVENTPAGPARAMRFRDIQTRLDRVLWESPRDSGRVVEVAAATATAFVFRDSLELRGARGRVLLRDSVVRLDFTRVELPASAAAVAGTVVRSAGESFYDLSFDADPFAFRDLRWISPDLPTDGGGRGRLLIQSRRSEGGTLWSAENAHVETGASTLEGALGVVLGDTTYFTGVELRAEPLEVALLGRLVPGGLPVGGLLSGELEASGPLSALVTAGDLRLQPEPGAGSESSAVSWRGVVDVRPGRQGARQLRAELHSFDLALLDAWRPGLRLGGALTGQVSAVGRLAGELQLEADVRHARPAGDTSRLVGQGTLTTGGGARSIDLQLELSPFALSELGVRFPGLAGLAGSAAGPVRLHGPLDRLDYDASLRTAAGPLHLRGQLASGPEGPRYSGTARLSGFRLNELLADVPAADLNGTIAFDITGGEVGSLRGNVRVLLDSAHLSRVPLRHSLLEARLADGLLLIDSLHAATLAGDLTARGSLGLVPERTGTMSLDLRSTSVGLLEADIFGAAASTEPEQPRLAGSVRARGELSGSLQQLRLQADGEVRQLVLGPLRLARGATHVDASALGTDSMRLVVSLNADSASAYGQLLDTTSLSLAHLRGTSSFVLSGRRKGAEADRLVLEGSLRRDADTVNVTVARLGLGEAGLWRLQDTARARLAPGLLRMQPLELRQADGEGVLRARGVLGWSADSATARPLDFEVQLSALPFADFLRAVRSEARGEGRLDANLRITGTTLDPLIDADLTGTRVGFDEVSLEHGFLELGFADRSAEVFLETQRDGRRVLAGNGTVPYDLRFTDVRQRRLDRPLDLTITADTLPAAQVLPFLDGFSNVRGWLNGQVRAAGTSLDPALSGELRADRLGATWSATGVRYADVNGTFRLVSDRVVAVDATARTQDPVSGARAGRGTVTGTLDFARLSDPVLDLNFDAEGVLASRRRDVEAVVTGDIRLGGRYTSPEVTATLLVDRGTMYIDEIYRQFFVVQLDSASMFQFVDTSLVAPRRLLPVSRSPFLDNLVIRNTRVRVGNGSWLRGQDLDVEVEGDLNVAYDRRADDLRITGSLAVLRGSYQLVYPPLQARRFRVSEGTVEFLGLPGIDPNLSISAVYRGRAGREPLDIIAQVSGTLQNPRVRLTSNEEPPISESDLASYLFFGVPTWEVGTLMGAGTDTRGALAGLGARTFAPSLLGYASSGLQTLAQGAGLLDYVSLTTADYGPGSEGAPGRLSLLSGAQLELGRYFTPDVYIGLSQRLANATAEPGLRLEWRLNPTYMLELFAEERFARNAPGFGYNQEALMKRVYGFFLFREWGY